jgi:diguanylate cyclase (GGDEF)-like protein
MQSEIATNVEGAGIALYDAVSRVTSAVSVAQRRRLIGWLAGGYLVCAVLPVLITATSGYDLHLFSTFVVLGVMLMAALVAMVAAVARLPDMRDSDGSLQRESRGWWLIAGGALLNLVGRGVYVADDLSGAEPGLIAASDVMFGSSALLIAAGLLSIPWSARTPERRSQLVDGSIIFISVGTLLWPVLFGPALLGELRGAFEGNSLASFLGGVFLLLALTLWILVQEIRRELLPVAVAFLSAVLVMVGMHIAAYWFAVGTNILSAESAQSGVVNALTSLIFALIALAGLFRLSVPSDSVDPEYDESQASERPIHAWQIVLPFPVIGALIAIRLSMELFGWQTEYRGGMGLGIGLITLLMMIRQLQMLKYNHQLFERASQASIRDGLTGLYNHRSMHDLLHSEIERAEHRGESLALFFLDIDHFKPFNDTYGHKRGDQLLMRVADALDDVSRAGDLTGRYGGEEFMVIAPGIDPTDAEKLGERLRTRIGGQGFILDGKRFGVTVSVGIAMYPLDSEDPEKLVELADQAMYAAKEAGRNTTRRYAATDVYEVDPAPVARATRRWNVT